MDRKHKSALPGNPIYLRHKWEIWHHESHRHRVRTVKPAIDINPPRTFMHLFINLKKIQAEQERISEIQKENRVLMSRIAEIRRGVGFVDHRNEYVPKSLNCWMRQNTMVRLAYDNLTTRRRLIDVHTEYNRNKFEDEFLLHKKYVANASKYPSNWKELIKEETVMKQEIRKDFLNKEKRMRKEPKRRVKAKSNSQMPQKKLSANTIEIFEEGDEKFESKSRAREKGREDEQVEKTEQKSNENDGPEKEPSESEGPEEERGEPSERADPEEERGEPSEREDPEEERSEPSERDDPEEERGEPSEREDPEEELGEPSEREEPEEKRGEPSEREEPEEEPSESEGPEEERVELSENEGREDERDPKSPEDQSGGKL